MPRPGLTATVTLAVTPDDTAPAFGSGDVPVAATPRLIALCEEATVAAIAGALNEDSTSVGVGVQIEHLRPSIEGDVVEATAVLETVEGSRLGFRVAVRNGDETLLAGSVTRVVVDRNRFLENAGVSG